MSTQYSLHAYFYGSRSRPHKFIPGTRVEVNKIKAYSFKKKKNIVEKIRKIHTGHTGPARLRVALVTWVERLKFIFSCIEQ